MKLNELREKHSSKYAFFRGSRPINLQTVFSASYLGVHQNLTLLSEQLFFQVQNHLSETNRKKLKTKKDIAILIFEKSRHNKVA